MASAPHAIDVGSRMVDNRDARRDRFDAVYADHGRAVLAFALRRTAQPADAADVVADTFLVAWRHIDSIPEDRARLWLYGAAHRVLANHGRGRRRRDRLGRRLASALADLTIADPAEAIGTAAVVCEAMASLPAEDRELLRLAVWEGLSGPDIAVVLGIPPATVRTRLHRARHRLRDVLDGDPRLDGTHRLRPGR